MLIVSLGSVHAAQPKRVIVSTDMAIGLQGGWRQMNDADDGWAVAMALRDPALNVALLATVFGNSNVAAEHLAARRLLELLHSHVPLARGAAVALDTPPATLLGQPVPQSCVNDAVEQMLRVLRRGHTTIIAIGPLTDVACLVQNAPASLVENIDEVIAVMGRAPHQQFAIGTVSGLTDFNLVMDSRAAAVLLNEGRVPLTFLQFDLTRQVLIPRALVSGLSGGTPLQRFIHDGTMPWIDFWQNVFGENGFHPWDSDAVWYASHPEAFTCSEVNYVLQPCARDAADPYNRLGDCAGHSADQKASLDKERVQLWLGANVSSSRTVRTCTGYKSSEQQKRFEDAATAFVK